MHAYGQRRGIANSAKSTFISSLLLSNDDPTGFRSCMHHHTNFRFSPNLHIRYKQLDPVSVDLHRTVHNIKT